MTDNQDPAYRAGYQQAIADAMSAAGMADRMSVSIAHIAHLTRTTDLPTARKIARDYVYWPGDLAVLDTRSGPRKGPRTDEGKTMEASIATIIDRAQAHRIWPTNVRNVRGAAPDGRVDHARSAAYLLLYRVTDYQERSDDRLARATVERLAATLLDAADTVA